MNKLISSLTAYIVRGKFQSAFVELFHALRSNYPQWKNAEQDMLNQDKDDLKERILDTLLSGSQLKLHKLSNSNPLSLLAALDEYIFSRYSGIGASLEAKVKVKKNIYLIHRRTLEASCQSTFSHQTGHLQAWLTYHWIIPEKINGFEIILRQAPIDLCKDCHQRKELRIYVSSFPDKIKPDWDEDSNALLAHGFTDKKGRWQSVLRSFTKASSEKADIVVFPELTICPELRDAVVTWLLDNPEHPFMLILPGSFHQRMDGSVYNYSELFDRLGEKVLAHKKLTTSGTKGRFENISTGKRIELLDTSFGLIAMPICLDFCEEGVPFGEIWEHISAEWLLVPAFGNTSSLNAHWREAKKLYRSHKAVSVVSNQHIGGEDGDYGFIYNKEKAKRPPGKPDLLMTVNISSISMPKKP